MACVSVGDKKRSYIFLQFEEIDVFLGLFFFFIFEGFDFA